MSKRVFRGRDSGFAEFLAEVEAVEGGTISPGGAAILMGFTRQGVWDMINSERVRSWLYYERWSKVPDYVEVSVRDLVEWGVQRGRIRSYEDCRLKGEVVRQEVERALEQHQSDARQLTR